jgi:hypothetical protein
MEDENNEQYPQENDTHDNILSKMTHMTISPEK